MARLAERPRASAGRRFPTGLDLGSTAVKWVQLGRVNGQVHIMDIGHQPRQAGGPTASEADRQRELRALLQSLVKQRRVGRAVVLSLPLEEVSLRVLKLPALPEGELVQAIRWQIEQTLPPEVSFEEFILDHVLLQDIATQWESKVLVASVPRQRVMKLVEQVRGAGLQPLAVEIDPFALAACLAWHQQVQAQDTVLLLHLGAKTASFSVIAKGQLAFSRSLLATGNSLTQAIADHLQVSWEQAEDLKRTTGLQRSQELTHGSLLPQAADEGVAVARALASPLESLIVDILHAFKSFSHQVAQSQIQRFDRIVLDGGGSRLPGLGPWLRARLNVPVELVDPLKSLPMTPQVTTDSRHDKGPALTLAMGLALREVPGGGPALTRMNLLPKELRSASGPRVMAGWLPSRITISPTRVIAVTVAGGLALAMSWPGMAMWRYRAGTQRLRGQLVQMRKMSAQLNTQQQALHVRQAELDAKHDRLADRQHALLGVRQAGLAASDVLHELARAVPADVWLTNVSVTGEAVHVIGATREPAAVVALMEALERSGTFHQTTFSSTQRSSQDAQTIYTFDISTMPRVGGAAS